MGCDMITWSATHHRKSVSGLGQQAAGQTDGAPEERVKVSQKGCGHPGAAEWRGTG